MKFSKILKQISLVLFSSFAIANKCDDVKNELKNNYYVNECVVDKDGKITTF